jgi:hypothetical protein
MQPSSSMRWSCPGMAELRGSHGQCACSIAPHRCCSGVCCRYAGSPTRMSSPQKPVRCCARTAASACSVCSTSCTRRCHANAQTLPRTTAGSCSCSAARASCSVTDPPRAQQVLLGISNMHSATRSLRKLSASRHSSTSDGACWCCVISIEYYVMANAASAQDGCM